MLFLGHICRRVLVLVHQALPSGCKRFEGSPLGTKINATADQHNLCHSLFISMPLLTPGLLQLLVHALKQKPLVMAPDGHDAFQSEQT